MMASILGRARRSRRRRHEQSWACRCLLVSAVRGIDDAMALSLQASLLISHAPPAVGTSGCRDVDVSTTPAASIGDCSSRYAGRIRFSEVAYEDPQRWRGRALARSLNRARSRSVERMERLLDAARELARETGSAAFTVNQVVARAGLSLKSFYGCFAGKDELLLALLEEDSSIGASLLAEQLGAHDVPVERLRAYVEQLFELLTHPGAVGYAGVLVREHRRLAESHPDELRLALSPLVGLLARELRRAAERGPVEVASPDRTAETVFGVLLGGIAEVTLARAEPRATAAFLWRFCWYGVRGDAEPDPARRES
jgi:AcrR family transcriptional regulator